MNEKDLDNINKIDMSFSGGNDDDDSFVVTDGVKGNNGFVQTGVIINFDDDDDDFNANMKKHASNASVDFVDKAPLAIPQAEQKGYNEIDMECKYGDDTEDDYLPPTKTSPKINSIFEDDEEDDELLDKKELVLEEDVAGMLATNKVSVMTIEDDYLKGLSKKHTAKDNMKKEELEEDLLPVIEKKQPTLKNILRDLQKKHNNSIKKGAMGSHYHFAGNPQKARDMFNAGIGNQTGGEVFPGMSMDTAVATLVGGGEAITGVAADGGSSFSSDGGGMSNGGLSAGGMSGGEGLEITNYSKILREVFDVIGFDVEKEKDGTLLAKDIYSDNNIVRAKNIEELIYALQPFIDTCIIIPLSISTKQKFNNYQDWCDWYTAENQEKFPKHAAEIKYCDLLANHIKECEF